MNPPRFWAYGQVPPALLRPFAALTTAITARRVAQPGFAASVPVICCGNPGAGGSGKTPLALDLGARLQARGRHPAFLTRGHGGRLRGPMRVLASHDAGDIGDEALLLAACAPCYTGANRAATARLAVADGADVLVLDDGLQNPSLVKSMSLLVIDGGAGFGNGWPMPAGPLREPALAAAGRCRAAILIGEDVAAARGQLSHGYPVLHADIVPDATDLAALPARVVAFAGIGRPAKFFDTLRAAGHPPLDVLAFPDHHRFTAADLDRIHSRAAALGAVAVTTQKDFVRLAPADRAGILTLGITLRWQDEAQIEALLDEALA
jgi:tetraacyldisaccharide 4'-kinase